MGDRVHDALCTGVGPQFSIVLARQCAQRIQQTVVEELRPEFGFDLIGGAARDATLLDRVAQGAEIPGFRRKEASNPYRVGMDGDFDAVWVGASEPGNDSCIGNPMGRNGFGKELRVPPAILAEYQPCVISQRCPERRKHASDFFVGRGLGADEDVVEGTLFHPGKRGGYDDFFLGNSGFPEDPGPFEVTGVEGFRGTSRPRDENHPVPRSMQAGAECASDRACSDDRDSQNRFHAPLSGADMILLPGLLVIDPLEPGSSGMIFGKGTLRNFRFHNRKVA